MTNQNNVIEKTTGTAANIIPRAWMFADIPKEDNRADVSMTITLPKNQYEQFRKLVNDDEVICQVFSGLLSGKLHDWVGKYWEVSESEIRNRIIAVAAERRAQD